MNYNTTTLPNGLRIIHLPSASPVVYCGYEVNAGAADESADAEGLAHFCEHTTFKGTARRSALDIINGLERVGGELNAFTTKTDTVYYAAIMNDYLPQAVDLLSDIVFHSIYPQAEIDKEVEVICDEIESYNDSPSELIFDEFENIIFRGTPLGHNILGTSARVRQFSTADALAFTRRLYRPDNAIFFAYGNIEFDKLVELLTEASPNAVGLSEDAKVLTPQTGSLNSCNPREPIHNSIHSEAVGEVSVRHLNTHQAHVMLGCRAYGVHDGRRMALYLLNNILGGPGMNARLNLNMRERHGLVYTVESMMVSYASTGLWAVYFGCDPKDVDECLKLVGEELRRVMTEKLSSDELESAKRQIKGQIGIACDNRESFALDFGKAFLHYGCERDISRLYSRIDAITSEEILSVANDLFRKENLTTLIFE